MASIVLLHGALGCGEDLASLKTALEAKGFLVYSLTFSGHSNASFESDFGIDQFVRELQSKIESLSQSPVSIFGYSMGGYVALEFCLRFPKLVESIITLGTKFNWNQNAIAKESSLCKPALILEKNPAFAHQLERKHQDWKLLLERTAEMINAFAQRKLLINHSAGSISTRVLFCRAENDKMVSAEETEKAKNLRSNGKLLTIPGAKHQFESVEIGLLSDSISDFVQQR